MLVVHFFSCSFFLISPKDHRCPTVHAVVPVTRHQAGKGVTDKLLSHAIWLVEDIAGSLTEVGGLVDIFTKGAGSPQVSAKQI